MTLNEIKSNLCYYDNRNPENNNKYNGLSAKEIKEKQKDCHCDNCYGGKTILAKELLRMYHIINGFSGN